MRREARPVVVELEPEVVEEVAARGEVTTYAAPSKTKATTKAVAATCVLLAPVLFKSAAPHAQPALSPVEGLLEPLGE